MSDKPDDPPRITKTPNLCGGDACVAGTRLSVWVLEGMRRLGLTDAELLLNYPTLREGDLVHVWAYVETNREEIDQAIRENQEDGDIDL